MVICRKAVRPRVGVRRKGTRTKTKQCQCEPDEIIAGDCWIGISLAQDSGLILAARVGKRKDQLLEEMLVTTEGKTQCQNWNTDGLRGYQRVLTEEIEHQISKKGNQRLERTNGILRQQTGRWHRQQNKFAKVWEQTKVTARLVVSYFNWIWKNIRLGTTAAQRSGLSDQRWTWHDLISYPTVI